MRVIAGTARGIRLDTPKGLETRPTGERVKEAVFSMLHFDLPGAKILDLFGGTGQLGIEALSRGAMRAVFVDKSDAACKLIRDNVKKTGFSNNTKIVKTDYETYLKGCCEKFNIVLLDPPYAEVFLENAIKLITEIDILQTNGIIVAERPLGKELSCSIPGYSRSKDYKYGNTLIALYRKNEAGEGAR